MRRRVGRGRALFECGAVYSDQAAIHAAHEMNG